MIHPVRATIVVALLIAVFLTFASMSVGVGGAFAVLGMVIGTVVVMFVLAWWVMS